MTDLLHKRMAPDVTRCRVVSRSTLAVCLALVSALAAVLTLNAPVSAGTNDWDPIGPAPLYGFFPGGVTGRAGAIAVNSQNGDQIWLGTAAGGVWYSADGGKHWAPMSDHEEALAIGDIELAGCDTDGCTTIYAGTGESAIRRDTYHGAGLLIGAMTPSPPSISWTLVDGGPSPTGGPAAVFRGGSIIDIERDPATSGVNTVLYIALSSGVTASGSEATVTHPEPSSGYGLYKTEDNGASWEKLVVPESRGALPTDLAMQPGEADVLYAGFMGQGIFKTTNGGADWCPLNPLIGPLPPGCSVATGLPEASIVQFDHVEIAISESSPQIVYATLGNCPDPLLDMCEPSTYRSFNGGQTWTLQRAPNSNPVYDQCVAAYTRYTHGLTVHPTVNSFLWIGGIKLCQSADSGQNFQFGDFTTDPGSGPWGPFLHLDHHEIAYDATDTGRLYSTSDGGFAYSLTGGGSWRTSNRDLQITGFHSIGASPLSTRVFGGSQDNGCSIWKGSKAWNRIDSCGDGGSTEFDRNTAMKLYAVTNVQFLGATLTGIFHRSEDGGQTWNPSILDPAPGPSDPKAFYPPITQNGSDPGGIYYGTNRLWESGDDGASWHTVTNGPLSTLEQPEIVGRVDVITAIAIAPSDLDRAWVGYNSGAIFNGQLFFKLWSADLGGSLPDAPVTGIVVDPLDAGTAIVTFSGFGHDHVWKTTDFGQNWTAFVTGLPVDVPVNTIAIEPGPPYELWVGLDSNSTGNTVFKRTDGDASWQSFSADLPNVPVYDFSIDSSRDLVYAATHGRGAWVLGELPVYPFEYWAFQLASSLPIFAQGLPPNETCTVELLAADGTPCASGEDDAMGGVIHTDSAGFLVTTRDEFSSELPVVWACFDGSCVGGTAIEECQPPQPVMEVRVTCGAESRSGQLMGPQSITGPPSSFFGLPSGADGTEASGLPAAFELTASMQDASGAARSLCSIRKVVGAAENNAQVFHSAMQAINDSATCGAEGVTAELEEGRAGGAEDAFPREPLLLLRAPGQEGSQLITNVHVAPGEANGACFQLAGLGVPVLNQLQATRLTFETSAGGAAGGQVRVVEHTQLGACAVTVDTDPGQAADEIASMLYSAFQAQGIPGPNAECSSDRNPRDVTMMDSSLHTVLASTLAICVDDPGVGFFVGGEDLGNVHPVAVAVGGPAVECTGPAGAQVLLDGTGSTDPDSSPGTNDDIVLFEWFENYGMANQTFLGSGDLLVVGLPLGTHEITLKVSDTPGLADLDTITLAVVDTTPPQLSGSVAPNLLWPANHGMVPVSALLNASDVCDPAASIEIILDNVTSDEADDAPGLYDGATVNDIQDAQAGTADFVVELRAERDSSLAGRTYTLTYTATDSSGNAASTPLTVFVPLDVAGVVEPIMITVTQVPGAGTLLEWTEHPDATHYTAIRGNLANITDTMDGYEMGPVVCIQAGAEVLNTLGNEDDEVPVPAEAFFYLVESANGYHSGYGTVSATKARRAQPPDPCN